MNMQYWYQLFSDDIKIEELDCLAGSSYYEWKAECDFCLLPSNDMDFIWDTETHTLHMVKYINQCRWIQGNGQQFLGIHVDADVLPVCETEKMEKWFSQIAVCEDFHQRITKVKREMDRVLQRQQIHPVLKMAIEEIRKNKGKTAIEDLKTDISFNYSIRQLERIFKEAYSYGPKQFCRKERFLFMVEYMIKNPEENIVKGLEEAGYSDRAHFQREFKKFCSMTPGQFIKHNRLC